jgi:hypothetical protein
MGTRVMGTHYHSKALCPRAKNFFPLLQTRAHIPLSLLIKAQTRMALTVSIGFARSGQAHNCSASFWAQGPSTRLGGEERGNRTAAVAESRPLQNRRVLTSSVLFPVAAATGQRDSELPFPPPIHPSDHLPGAPWRSTPPRSSRRGATTAQGPSPRTWYAHPPTSSPLPPAAACVSRCVSFLRCFLPPYGGCTRRRRRCGVSPCSPCSRFAPRRIVLGVGLGNGS